MSNFHFFLHYGQGYYSWLYHRWPQLKPFPSLFQNLSEGKIEASMLVLSTWNSPSQPKEGKPMCFNCQTQTYLYARQDIHFIRQICSSLVIIDIMRNSTNLQYKKNRWQTKRKNHPTHGSILTIESSVKLWYYVNL